jgi:twitching motility protein PilT
VLAKHIVTIEDPIEYLYRDETINRILEFYEPHEQMQARSMLASVLRGVISQRLVMDADGEGRVAICEVLRQTGRVSDTIKDGDVSLLPEIIAEGGFYGMQTFDQALYEALTAGKITMETALEAASRRHDFKLLVEGEGRIGTTMEDVVQEEKEATTPLNGDTGRDPASLIPGL